MRRLRTWTFMTLSKTCHQPHNALSQERRKPSIIFTILTIHPFMVQAFLVILLLLSIITNLI